MYYPTEVKEAAKRLFLRRCKAKEIQAQLKLPNIRIVYYWIRQGGWEDMLSDEEPLTAVSRRITLLLEKQATLTKGELDELDRLTCIALRVAQAAARQWPWPAGWRALRWAPIPAARCGFRRACTQLRGGEVAWQCCRRPGCERCVPDL